MSPDRERKRPRLSSQPARYLPPMERTTILSSLAASGTDTAPQRLTELAAELDIPAADLLVVAGKPVPAKLLPPKRDAGVMRQFAYRVSYCCDGGVRSWCGWCAASCGVDDLLRRGRGASGPLGGGQEVSDLRLLGVC